MSRFVFAALSETRRPPSGPAAVAACRPSGCFCGGCLFGIWCPLDFVPLDLFEVLLVLGVQLRVGGNPQARAPISWSSLVSLISTGRGGRPKVCLLETDSFSRGCCRWGAWHALVHQRSMAFSSEIPRESLPHTAPVVCYVVLGGKRATNPSVLSRATALGMLSLK